MGARALYTPVPRALVFFDGARFVADDVVVRRSRFALAATPFALVSTSKRRIVRAVYEK